MKKWRCKVCGYIHEGDTPPDVCPLCGVGPEEFVEVAAEAAPAAPKAKRWKCTVCDYIHEGDEPPDVCPVCGVGKEFFVLLEDTIRQLSADSVKESNEGTSRAALDKVSYGLYVVSSFNKEGKINGQICNTVFQLTDPPLRIAVCLNKNNLTQEYVFWTQVILPFRCLDRNNSTWFAVLATVRAGRSDKFAEAPYVKGQNGCPNLMQFHGLLGSKSDV